MKSKGELRKEMKQLKLSLSANEMLRESNRVFSSLLSSDLLNEPKCILLYYSLPDELPTQHFVQLLYGQHRVCLPRVDGDDIIIEEYSPDTMRKGSFGIYEPFGGTIVKPEEVDLIVVPGVAFDENCSRLGRGRGYYDRLLRNCNNATKIGVCLSCQLLHEPLPIEPHDISMDVVMTPNENFYNNHNE